MNAEDKAKFVANKKARKKALRVAEAKARESLQLAAAKAREALRFRPLKTGRAF